MIIEQSGIGDTVSPNLEQLVNEIETEIDLMSDYREKSEKWTKMELCSAIKCGENLVKIRSAFCKRGDGFKSFVTTRFQPRFSYKTCGRYMKLFKGKDKLDDSVTNLNQAYVLLGIKREIDLDSDDGDSVIRDDKDSTKDHTQRHKKTNKNRRNSNQITLVETPKRNSILIPFFNEI